MMEIKLKTAPILEVIEIAKTDKKAIILTGENGEQYQFEPGSNVVTNPKANPIGHSAGIFFFMNGTERIEPGEMALLTNIRGAPKITLMSDKS